MWNLYTLSESFKWKKNFFQWISSSILLHLEWSRRFGHCHVDLPHLNFIASLIQGKEYLIPFGLSTMLQSFFPWRTISMKLTGSLGWNNIGNLLILKKKHIETPKFPPFILAEARTSQVQVCFLLPTLLNLHIPWARGSPQTLKPHTNPWEAGLKCFPSSTQKSESSVEGDPGQLWWEGPPTCSKLCLTHLQFCGFCLWAFPPLLSRPLSSFSWRDPQPHEYPTFKTSHYFL